MAERRERRRRRAQVLATYEGEEADEWELDGTAAITRNPYGSGETYFVGCDLNVADLTEFVRENIVEDSANVANPADSDVLHTVRKSADATFDFYLPRGKKEIALQGIEGEPIYLSKRKQRHRRAATPCIATAYSS